MLTTVTFYLSNPIQDLPNPSPTNPHQEHQKNDSGFNYEYLYRSKSASFLGDILLSTIVARQQGCPVQPSECSSHPFQTPGGKEVSIIGPISIK